MSEKKLYDVLITFKDGRIEYVKGERCHFGDEDATRFLSYGWISESGGAAQVAGGKNIDLSIKNSKIGITSERV